MVERLPEATVLLNENPHTRGRIPSHQSSASKAPKAHKTPQAGAAAVWLLELDNKICW